MATTIPDSLKSADIGRFVTRAAQIERAKPVIAYWCNYWVVNQIISKGLHSADAESTQYTTDLMDKLERFKNENPDNDAITDNVAGQAYVEQFGLEVFARADNAVRANKATKQTADTFLAAATFLELCQIWGDVDPDITSKIKFAKYHAVRIAKAIKNGEDPNLSNPVVESQAPDSEIQALNPDDPEVQALQGTARRERQPSVEEVPDEADRIQRSLAQQSILDESLHPSRSSSLPRPPTTDTSKADDIPAVPSAPELPSAPSDLTLPQTPSALPDTPETFTNPSAEFQSFPPPAVVQMSHAADPSDQPPLPPSIAQQPVIPRARAPAPALAPARAPVPLVTSTAPVSQASRYDITADDQAITEAQKHARWAVSALSFDDVPTAIKELKNALRQLGVE